jgi:ABC-type ATPase with predicted acetyltransferase domain
MLDDQLIGVCIYSLPRGLLAARHELFPALKPGRDTKVTNTYRFKWVNANIRVNSRTVVDTMFRGVGVAYRLLNLAARMDGHRFLEIQSSMSRYNQFAQRAGFKFTKPRASQHYEAGLKFFHQNFKANPIDYVAVMEELSLMEEKRRAVVEGRLRTFYYAHSALEKTGQNRDKGTSRVDAMPIGQILKNTQQLVFAMPMYGVYQNPDYGRELPKCLPLTAFDLQKPHEPLRLDLLEKTP